MQKSCLICITGLAGSGKTTLANNLENKLKSQGCNVVHYTSDYIGKFLFPETQLAMTANPTIDYSSTELATIYSGLFMLFEELLKANPNTIIITDGMYRKASQRLLLRVIAEKLERPFYLIKVETTPEIAKKRLIARSMNGDIGGWVDPIEYEEPWDKDLIKVPNDLGKPKLKTHMELIFKRMIC